MDFTKETENDSKIQKTIKKILNFKMGEKTLLFYLLSVTYWLVAIYLYNDYMQYKKRYVLYNYYYNSDNVGFNNDYTVLIIAAIIFLIILGFTKNLKITYLLITAGLVLLANILWFAFKIVLLILSIVVPLYIMYAIFRLLFKISNKVETKYNNLDDSKKSLLKSILFFILRVVFKFGCKEIINNASSSNSSFVDPHDVSGYTRADGTHVNGYYRDGDGNPFTNLSKEEGGGYYRGK